MPQVIVNVSNKTLEAWEGMAKYKNFSLENLIKRAMFCYGLIIKKDMAQKLKTKN